MLADKTIVLGVSGSIAAYKAADIASKLFQAGANVKVIMTQSATELVKPITFQAVTKNPVAVEMFAPTSDARINHVSLGELADVIVIAPATANIIAKMANGIADDLLTCTVLATRAPVIVAPAMHTAMWENPATQENVVKLKVRGFIFVEPETGHLASGGTGAGRLATTERILGTIRQVLGKSGDLVGKRVVVTAGGTQEAIDPVRYVGNRSSGKMGFAIAEAARDRGAAVTLISAPTSLEEPAGISLVKVNSAAEMKEAVDKAVKEADVLIMAAAVADYRPKQAAEQKIKKDAESLKLEMARTMDILGSVKGDFIRVGFAAESQDLIENARQKLVNKHLDLIVANDITAGDSGFGTDTNKVALIDRNGKLDELPLLPKSQVADKILDKVVWLTGNPKREMKVEAVVCQTENDAEIERNRASDENRIFLVIKPKRKYAEVAFDIFTVDPMVCNNLSEEGTKAVETLYHNYLAGIKADDAKKFTAGVDVSYGPQTGSMLVLAEDADKFVDDLVKILRNQQYWEGL